MTTKWTLRDMDNRDDNYEPWKVTDTPRALSKYIDEVVRNDLIDDSFTHDIDDLVKAFRSGHLELSQQLGKQFGIYVQEARNA